MTKFKNLFILKLLRILEIVGSFLSVIRGIYNKPRVNILFNDETLYTFPYRNKEKMFTLTAF